MCAMLCNQSIITLQHSIDTYTQLTKFTSCSQRHCGARPCTQEIINKRTDNVFQKQ